MAGSSEAAAISSAAVETSPEKRVAYAFSSSASSSCEIPRWLAGPVKGSRNGSDAQPETAAAASAMASERRARRRRARRVAATAEPEPAPLRAPSPP
jgi:hypothetical protein